MGMQVHGMDYWHSHSPQDYPDSLLDRSLLVCLAAIFTIHFWSSSCFDCVSQIIASSLPEDHNSHGFSGKQKRRSHGKTNATRSGSDQHADNPQCGLKGPYPRREFRYLKKQSVNDALGSLLGGHRVNPKGTYANELASVREKDQLGLECGLRL